MKKGFTLIELLVVIAILGLLMAVFVFALKSAPEKAQKAKCEDFVKKVYDALVAVRKDPGWSSFHGAANSEEGLDEDVAYPIGRILEYDVKDGQLIGLGRFGIVTPWAEKVIKDLGSDASLSSGVPTGGTVRDHRLCFALDFDEDGIVEAVVGGESVRIRADAAVWCGGADGQIEPYSDGLKADDVYSWHEGQVVR